MPPWVTLRVVFWLPAVGRVPLIVTVPSEEVSESGLSVPETG